MTAQRSRVNTIRLIGGRPCMDLLNTVSWRGVSGRHDDHLVDSSACLVWSRRADVIDEAEGARLANLDIRRPLLMLRETLATHLFANSQPGADLDALQPLLHEALQHSRLVPDQNRAQWQVAHLDAHTPARRVALDLLDMLTNPPGPVRRCQDPECSWVFVDTSRGHRRHWCSSADCGNRERVRRHAARSTAKA